MTSKRAVCVTIKTAEGKVTLRYPMTMGGAPTVPTVVAAAFYAEPAPEVTISVEETP